mgnify:CR=1 FL=1
MKDFLACLITIMFFTLWLIPLYVVYQKGELGGVCLLYIPILILTACWGDVLNKTYFKKY